MSEQLFPFCAVYKNNNEYGWVVVPALTRNDAMREAVLYGGKEGLIIMGIHLLKKDGYLDPDGYKDEDDIEVMVHEDAKELDDWCDELKKTDKKMDTALEKIGVIRHE